MTGRKNGLTGHFLQENPMLINTHCSAHRLALCTEQAAQKIPGTCSVIFNQSSYIIKNILLKSHAPIIYSSLTDHLDSLAVSFILIRNQMSLPELCSN